METTIIWACVVVVIGGFAFLGWANYLLYLMYLDSDEDA